MSTRKIDDTNVGYFKRYIIKTYIMILKFKTKLMTIVLTDCNMCYWAECQCCVPKYF